MVDFAKQLAVQRWKMERLSHTPKMRFKLFVQEREDARIDKELVGGPGPHSHDPIIALNRFCNINREHDAVTRWVRAWARRELEDKGPKEHVVQFLAARIWNHPPTLEQILPVISPRIALLRLDKIRAAGGRTMRGAYMMPVHGNKGKGCSVDQYYMAAVEEAQEFSWKGVRSLGDVADRLTQIKGIGEFIANQVIADLRYHPWGAAMPDAGTFVLCGPGTRRGLDRYVSVPRHKLGTGPQEMYVSRLLQIRQDLQNICFFSSTFRDPNNLANAFCEWDKHERVLCGEVARLKKYP